MKWCKFCNQNKPLSEFYDNKKLRDGKRNICKNCFGDWRKKWKQEHPEETKRYAREYYHKNKHRIYSKSGTNAVRTENQKEIRRNAILKRQYGITLIEFRSLLSDQSGKCKICSLTFDASNRRTAPHLDHDHKTGKIRGVLCHCCNVGIGSFRDNPTTIISAAKYLREGVVNEVV